MRVVQLKRYLELSLNFSNKPALIFLAKKEKISYPKETITLPSETKGWILNTLHVIGERKSRPSVDVVFIHGLWGDPFGTWAATDNQLVDSWPYWLAAQLEDAAVYTLEYDASPFKFTGDSMPLEDCAAAILRELEVEELGQRPTIFICHSLGGIILKETLRLARDVKNRDLKAIYNSTREVVFLGTPHAGSQWASRMAAKVVASPTLKSLENNDAHLRNLDLWYRNNAKWKTNTYFEKKKTPLSLFLPFIQGTAAKGYGPGILVVGEKDAVAGIPGELPVPLNENHISIAKPKSKKNKLYAHILSDVKRIKKQPPITRRRRRNPTRYQPTEHVISTPGLSEAYVSTQSGWDTLDLPDPLGMPSSLGDFCGREKEIENILSFFRDQRDASILIIRGLPGVGKTALAIKVASTLKRKLSLETRFVRLLGTNERPLEPLAIINKLIQSFEEEAASYSDLYLALRRYRTVLEKRHVLFVLDNARDSNQLKPLIDPGTRAPNARILITCQQSIVGFGETLENVSLGVMSVDEARAFLRHMIGEGRATDAQLEEIAENCWRLPQLLRSVGSHFQNSPTWTGHDVIAHFSEVGVLGGDDLMAISLSIRGLEQESPEMAPRWRTLRVFPTDFDRAAAAAVWACDTESARSYLDELERRSIIEFDPHANRYEMHDIFRSLASKGLVDASLSESIDWSLLKSNHTEAVFRHAAHYGKVLGHAGSLFRLGGDRAIEGLRLFDLEQINIEAGQTASCEGLRAGETRFIELAADYGYVAADILHLRLTVSDRILWFETQREASRLLLDNIREGAAFAGLGYAFFDDNQLENAASHFRSCLKIAAENDNSHAEGQAIANLTHVNVVQVQKKSDSQSANQMEELIGSYHEALDILRAFDDHRAVARVLSGLGSVYLYLNDPSEAENYFDRCLNLARKIGDQKIESDVLGNLGLIATRSGDLEKAIELQQESEAISIKINDRRGRANVLGLMAYAYAKNGATDRAAENYRLQLELWNEVGSNEERVCTLENLAKTYHTLGQVGPAIECLERAINIKKNSGYEGIEHDIRTLERWREET